MSQDNKRDLTESFDVPTHELTTVVDGHRIITAGTVWCPEHLASLKVERSPEDREKMRIGPCPVCVKEKTEDAKR